MPTLPILHPRRSRLRSDLSVPIVVSPASVMAVSLSSSDFSRGRPAQRSQGRVIHGGAAETHFHHQTILVGLQA